MFIASNRVIVRPSAAVASENSRRWETDSVETMVEEGRIENPSRQTAQNGSPLYRPDAGRATLQIARRNAPPTRPFTDFGAARAEFDSGAGHLIRDWQIENGTESGQPRRRICGYDSFEIGVIVIGGAMVAALVATAIASGILGF